MSEPLIALSIMPFFTPISHATLVGAKPLTTPASNSIPMGRLVKVNFTGFRLSTTEGQKLTSSETGDFAFEAQHRLPMCSSSNTIGMRCAACSCAASLPPGVTNRGVAGADGADCADDGVVGAEGVSLLSLCTKTWAKRRESSSGDTWLSPAFGTQRSSPLGDSSWLHCQDGSWEGAVDTAPGEMVPRPALRSSSVALAVAGNAVGASPQEEVMVPSLPRNGRCPDFSASGQCLCHKAATSGTAIALGLSTTGSNPTGLARAATVAGLDAVAKVGQKLIADRWSSSATTVAKTLMAGSAKKSLPSVRCQTPVTRCGSRPSCLVGQ
mmetsp:Transcript_73117/g.156657  ORF Transcript_73117/g.156657 Transcript_73117/m.156657 type:complete len:325 (+) Transcript_73117:100-1074(+)